MSLFEENILRILLYILILFLQEICLELACSPLRMLRNNRCEVMFSQIRNIFYELTLRLNPVGGCNADFNDLFTMKGLLNSGLDDKTELQNLLSALSLFSDTPDLDTYM